MKIVLDLDGAIVNFHKAFFERIGVTYNPQKIWEKHLGEYNICKLLGISYTKFLEIILGEYFWSSMEWTEDGKEILKIVEEIFGRENITLCSYVPRIAGAYDGKLTWIHKNMHPHYWDSFVATKKKEFGARFDKLLIDDCDENIDTFQAHGGRVCIIPRMWNSHYRFQDITLKFLHTYLKRTKEIYDAHQRSILPSPQRNPSSNFSSY